MQKPSPRFRSGEYFVYEISEEMFTQIYRDLYGDAIMVLFRMSTNMAEFCYKSVNLSLEELINIRVILFLIH